MFMPHATHTHLWRRGGRAEVSTDGGEETVSAHRGAHNSADQYEGCLRHNLWS